MIQFGRLLSFPMTFGNLTPKLRELRMGRIEATESGGLIRVSADVNGHQVQMIIHGPTIESSLPTEISCDCPFFAYNLAYTLSKAGSLLNPQSFVLRPPRTKNTSLTLSGCKHIVLLAQTLFQNRQLIKSE